MAFFKFRWPGKKEEAEQPSSRRASRNAQSEGIESLRRRARHRLIGAAVLVLLGVVGFPLLFDTQPRPVAVDVPIEIPDRNQVAPMVVPGEHTTMPANPRGAAMAPPRGAPAAVGTENSLGEGEEVFTPSTPAPATGTALPVPPPVPRVTPPVAPPAEVKKPEPKPEPKVEPKKPEPKPEPKPESKPEPKKPSHDDEAARARALLEGRSPAASAAQPAAAKQEGRFIVQVGAFADADKAREVRQRLQGAGLNAYTQDVNTAAGKRIRVRVGPFNGRDAADKAAARIKGMGLAAAVQPA